MKSIIGTVTLTDAAPLDHVIFKVGGDGNGDHATVKSIYIQAVSTNSTDLVGVVKLIGKGLEVGIKTLDIQNDVTSYFSIENGNALLGMGKSNIYAIKLTCPATADDTVVFNYVVNYE